MKKIIALLMALTMLFSAAAMAEETAAIEGLTMGELTAQSDEATKLDGLGLGEVSSISDVTPDITDAQFASFAGSTDVVMESGSTYTVTTAAGLVFKFNANGAYAITQDFKQDAWLYNQLFSDPQGFYNKMIQENIHLMLIDESARNLVLVRDLGVSELSSAVGNSMSLTTNDADYIAGLVATDLGTFKNNVQYGILGNQVWFVCPYQDMIIGYTFAGGHLIVAQIEGLNSAAGDTAFQMLDALTIN